MFIKLVQKIINVVEGKPAGTAFRKFFDFKEKTLSFRHVESVNHFDKYVSKLVEKPSTDSIALDLGCGNYLKNPFNANKACGCDLFQDLEKNIYKCKLGFEKIPFDTEELDYLTAFDLIEHIPRYSDIDEIGNTPFIYFMNETYRVLKTGGYFLSVTPCYPYPAAFQDPTHNNIITADTFRFYFSDKKYEHVGSYGIKTNFKIIDQKIWGQHLVALMQK